MTSSFLTVSYCTWCLVKDKYPPKRRWVKKGRKTASHILPPIFKIKEYFSYCFFYFCGYLILGKICFWDEDFIYLLVLEAHMQTTACENLFNSIKLKNLKRIDTFFVVVSSCVLLHRYLSNCTFQQSIFKMVTVRSIRQREDYLEDLWISEEETALKKGRSVQLEAEACHCKFTFATQSSIIT